MADIVLKDRSGNAITYPGINYIKTETADGGTQGFAAYDPETLVAENLANGVQVGDVTGVLSVPESVEKTVELDFSNGDMEVTPDAGQTFSKISIPVPDGLSAGNIAKDVEIAGIVGTMEAGGGTEGAYVEYTLDSSGNITAAKVVGCTICPTFYYNTTLTSVDLTESPNLTKIPDYCFSFCTALTSFTIPASVTTIGYQAFYRAGVTSVTFEDTTTWKRYSSATATSGTTISSTYLSNTSTAASYLSSASYYTSYYWKKT